MPAVDAKIDGIGTQDSILAARNYCNYSAHRKLSPAIENDNHYNFTELPILIG